jgi:hypothetical protein
LLAPFTKGLPRCIAMKWPKSSAKQNSSEKTTFLKLFNINYLKYEIKVPRDCQELPESCLFIKKKNTWKTYVF